MYLNYLKLLTQFEYYYDEILFTKIQWDVTQNSDYGPERRLAYLRFRDHVLMLMNLSGVTDTRVQSPGG